MPRGPRPIPTHLKKLLGNPGRRPLNAAEPEVKAAIPAPPDILDDLARQEWDRLSKQLYDLGLLTEIDRDALALYCQTWSNWVEAQKLVKELGPIVPVGKDDCPIVNPAITAAAKFQRELRALMAEFGMTPSARSRVHATHKGKSITGGRIITRNREAERN